MPLQVVNTAVLTCPFGLAPGTLTVLPTNLVFTENQPAANIMDHIPLVNIGTFGMCTSLANPQVAAATSAALGVLTPMPCIPATTSPWTPGCATTQLAFFPALNNTSVCNCMWGGVIQVAYPGQTTELVD